MKNIIAFNKFKEIMLKNFEPEIRNITLDEVEKIKLLINPTTDHECYYTQKMKDTRKKMYDSLDKTRFSKDIHLSRDDIQAQDSYFKEIYESLPDNLKLELSVQVFELVDNENNILKKEEDCIEFNGFEEMKAYVKEKYPESTLKELHSQLFRNKYNALKMKTDKQIYSVILTKPIEKLTYSIRTSECTHRFVSEPHLHEQLNELANTQRYIITENEEVVNTGFLYENMVVLTSKNEIVFTQSQVQQPQQQMIDEHPEDTVCT